MQKLVCKKFSALAAVCAFLLSAAPVFAQPNVVMTEQGAKVKTPVRDNFYDRVNHKEAMPLEYEYVNERDVMWEKRIWREIPLNEKRNHTFNYAVRPLIQILLEAAALGQITAYSTLKDDFTIPLCLDDVAKLCGSADTLMVTNPDTREDEMTVVYNKFDYNTVRSFRLKEVWYFDSKYGKLNVRIMGIAPVVARYNSEGIFLHEAPMCWFYYPELRNLLAREEAFNSENEAANWTWDDVFNARLFASYITKEGNVYDRRIADYKTHLDALVEANVIHETMRNFELDMWEH